MSDPQEDFFSFKQDQDKGSVVFKDIRKTVARDTKKDLKDYKWAGGIHPSSLCFDMCPKQFLRIDVRKKTDKGLKMAYLGSRGTACHREFQDKLVRGKALYRKMPDFSRVDFRHWEKVIDKFAHNFPEIPAYMEISSHRIGKEDFFLDVTGIADGVIEYNKKPAALDFKFKTIDAAKWEAFKSTLPLDKDVAQLATYCYVFDTLKYYPDPIDIAIGGYYNNCLIGMPEAEHECVIDTIPLKLMVKQLFQEFEDEWLDILTEKDNPCKWEYCKEHGKGWSYKRQIKGDRETSV